MSFLIDCAIELQNAPLNHNSTLLEEENIEIDGRKFPSNIVKDWCDININTVRPLSPRFFVPEKIRVDRNVLDRGSSYAMECKIVKKSAV